MERSRPLRANDPNWVVIDFEMDDDEFRACIAIARSQGLPFAVWLRRVIRIGLEATRKDE
jgi:hypothetical protein